MRAKTFIQAVLKFFGHLFLATYGVTLLVFGLGYALAAAFDPQGYAVNYFFVSPSFAVPVAAGLLFGYGFGWRLPPLACHLIPVPPLALVVIGLYDHHQNGVPWARILTRFFGTTCTGEDCHYQFGGQAIAVAPLVAALAYVIGAAVGRRKRTASSASAGPEYSRWKRRAYIGLAVVAVLTLSVLQRVAHLGNELEFYWSAATGFQRASLTFPPAPQYPPVSRLLKIVVAPIDRLIILQTKPHIASQMRKMAWKDATGCAGPITLLFLPVVLGLDDNYDHSCPMRSASPAP